MKNPLKLVSILALSATALFATTMAAATPGIDVSTNITNGISMNCIGNTGGNGPAIDITPNVPFISWWGGLSSHFNGTNLQCKFTTIGTPSTTVGTAQIMVYALGNGALAGAIQNVANAPGYLLTAQGTDKAPHLGPVYFNYTLTVNKS